MKKLLLLFVFAFAIVNLAKANVTDGDDPIIMTEKVDNPISGHGDPPKSPGSTLKIYQNGSTFYFGDSLVGCSVSILLNNVVAYTGTVGTDGTVTIPASFTGTFELQITIGSTVYSAYIDL